MRGEVREDVSVVVPTIGRTALLEQCLRSIAACRPRAGEVLVVDQSAGPEVARVIAGIGDARVRRVDCPGRGIPLAVNTGLKAARGPAVAVTHDDCTVAPDWVGAAAAALAAAPADIVTGRVSPVGDPEAVPATRDEIAPRAWSDPSDFWAILPNNMIAPREALLALGGFDERFTTAGEDLDLSFRWLYAGGVIRYEPAMRVWHHHWRSPRELRRTYVAYARGCGVFYAKNVRQRRHARLMLRYVLSDLRHLAAGTRDAIRDRDPHWDDDRLGAMPGLFLGLAYGWRTFRAR
jgi:GT2 family glycosyltransferase